MSRTFARNACMPMASASLLHRSGQASVWHRLLHGARRVWERNDWAAFAGADWIERIMEAQVTDRFHAKQGRSTGRWVLHHDGKELNVYLKRHYRLPWWQGLLTALAPDSGWSPGWHEWRNLEWARQLGLLVPSPVAAGEMLQPGGKLQSFLAVEELTGMLPLHEAIPLAARQLDAASFRRWKAGLAAELARMVRLMHDGRVYHQDLYLCHFFIRRVHTLCLPEWHNRVHLIDLHRLGRHPWVWPVYAVKDLAQFLYSSHVAGLTTRDRLRFWRCYVGTPATRSARWLAWFVRLKEARYRNHNLKRKAEQQSFSRDSKGSAEPAPAHAPVRAPLRVAATQRIKD